MLINIIIYVYVYDTRLVLRTKISTDNVQCFSLVNVMISNKSSGLFVIKNYDYLWWLIFVVYKGYCLFVMFVLSHLVRTCSPCRSNFQFIWPWEEWAYVLDLPKWAPQRVFVQEVLEREVRLSYWEKIKQVMIHA